MDSFGHLLIRVPCDSRTPINPPEEVLQALPPDPEIVKLEQRREELKAGTHRIKRKDVEEEVRRLTTMINSANVGLGEGKRPRHVRST